jgi:hypothetical protein
MTEPARVEFVGAAAAMEDLRRWSAQVAPAVAKAAEPFGERVADVVRARVPVLSGQLAGSVESAGDDEGVELSMGAGLDYAGWIEFGGGRGRPYIPEGRYLYPTALAAQDEFATVAGDAAADSAGRFAWSTPSP